MQINRAYNDQYSEAIIRLYKEAFATGQSEQYIDSAELQTYIGKLLNEGDHYVATENDRLIGAILTSPLASQEFIPDEIKANFIVEKCVYVAEMMVTESSRGQGIGRALLNHFLENLDKQKYTDVFIRVWDQNIAALSLYKKIGFTPYCTIDQTKLRANGTESFIMRKVYLHLACR